MNEVKISIITVAFNAEDTIERTLQSVRDQSYEKIEHVIVDGKSRDKTIDIVKKYQCDNLKWLSEPDNGIYDAMNKAVALCSGTYICFLNAGDIFFDNNTVEKIINALPTNFYPEILYGETAIVNNNGLFLHMRRLKAPEKLNWKSFKHGMLVCHQSFILKRELFEPYDLQYRYSSDFDWCIRMMKKSTSLLNTKVTLVNYLNEGVTTANRKASLKERYKIMVKHYGSCSTFIHHIWFAIRLIINPEK